MKKANKILFFLVAGLLLSSCSNGGNSSSNIDSSASNVDSSIPSSNVSSSTSSSSSSSQTQEKPNLTQSMLDVFNVDKLSFDGNEEIKLYDIRTNKYKSTYTLPISTYMDGEHWTAKYVNNSTQVETTIYYAKHNGLANQVNLSLNNVESYEPLKDDLGNKISWDDGGLYNSLKGLSVTDFEYSTVTGRYHYIGSSETLVKRVSSSANPYDFVGKDLSLIIEDNEIIGVNILGEDDYTLSSGAKAVPSLILTVNYGDVVEVPTIKKFTYDEDTQSYLKTAIQNMKNLTSYNTRVRILTQSMYSSGIQVSGYYETVTNDDLVYNTLSTNTNGESIKDDNGIYGYHDFKNGTINTFSNQVDNENKPIQNSYVANRAYLEDSINKFKPSFDFAPEIFVLGKYDQTTKERTYFVDESMSRVASTFYYGVGSDVNLYGNFAARGYTSSTTSFTPYVTVNEDGYINYACFYFNLGLMYGVVEIDYSDFNTASVESDNITFEQRNLPSSWNELTIINSHGDDDTSEDEVINAKDFFVNFFNDENILDTLPFFGSNNCLGDAYGFGITQKYRPTGMSYYLSAVNLYYDVPLDNDNTINSSLNKVYSYLESLGFVNKGNRRYVKGNITVEPVDSDLDLMIYIYKTSDNPNIK